MFEITNVAIFPHSTDHNPRAFASITISEVFIIKDLKIIARESGDHFVAMPARQDKNGTFHDLCHPLNQQTRKYIEDAVLDAYEQYQERETQEAGK